MRAIELKVTSYNLLTQSRSWSAVIRFNQIWWLMPGTPAIKKLRQEDQCESKASLDCLVSSRLTWATYRDTVPRGSKKKKSINKKAVHITHHTAGCACITQQAVCALRYGEGASLAISGVYSPRTLRSARGLPIPAQKPQL